MWGKVAGDPVTFRFSMEMLRWAGLEEIVRKLAARYGLECRLLSTDTRLVRTEYRFALEGKFGDLTHFAAGLHASLQEYHQQGL